ncbi:hypothetical protein CDD82_4272 [Ophiocordyceps australis]|uniref:Uncharacterized protein n=1 Tax=Ophiocordyceps australis TaxID=1399860 RepID=A0A2C5XKZ6_9HYPO|nr:hypothetical protein CDD82_4272 [Ophiocordyceps australis]
MAGFARSFKPPSAYLSPCRRPAMPGRTLSNSSERSATSNASGAPVDDMHLGPSATPDLDATCPLAKAASPDHAPSIALGRSGSSRPIAIEMPKVKKLTSTTSVYTPPEPLSARGDLPGGYFPMHEDPKGRVHRPHPFHQDPIMTRHQLHPDSAAALQPDRKPPTSHALSKTQANMPVSSYLAAGFHDSPVPMGKYYPSNYEQHQRKNVSRRIRPPMGDGLSTSLKSDSQVPKQRLERSQAEASEADTRRKIQQYQRDMITQAAMALGGSSRMVTKSGAGVSLSGLPVKDVWFTGAAMHKPASPRLDPLGSPGPVTPMDLESGPGGYLDREKIGSERLKENSAPPGTGFTSHSM